jgi:hypothetical protein
MRIQPFVSGLIAVAYRISQSVRPYPEAPTELSSRSEHGPRIIGAKNKFLLLNTEQTAGFHAKKFHSEGNNVRSVGQVSVANSDESDSWSPGGAALCKGFARLVRRF